MQRFQWVFQDSFRRGGSAVNTPNVMGGEPTQGPHQMARPRPARTPRQAPPKKLSWRPQTTTWRRLPLQHAPMAGQRLHLAAPPHPITERPHSPPLKPYLAHHPTPCPKILPPPQPRPTKILWVLKLSRFGRIPELAFGVGLWRSVQIRVSFGCFFCALLGGSQVGLNEFRF
jgi:hypothetical protein